MTDKEIKDFPEFDYIYDLDPMDGIVELLKCAKKYTEMAEAAKKEANALSSVFEKNTVFHSSDGTGFLVTTKTTPKVDVSVLKEMYPDVYKSLCDKGEVTISTKSVNKDEISGAIVNSTSSYVMLSR